MTSSGPEPRFASSGRFLARLLLWLTGTELLVQFPACFFSVFAHTAVETNCLPRRRTTGGVMASAVLESLLVSGSCALSSELCFILEEIQD